MKKKSSRQPNVFKQQLFPQQKCRICQQIISQVGNTSLFQINYERIAKTINQTMQRPTYLSTISKIIERQPSKQLINFQQIQKNLQFQEYLRQYCRFDKIPEKIQKLIPKHISNVKANYMDFKIKNFMILNKYRIAEKGNLPYPLCNKFQKQTDSKMSSTKSVENKVLQELQKQLKEKQKIKFSTLVQGSKQKRKICKQKRQSNQKFQIKALTKSIGEMIQNIKDNRALQNFKRQMQKSSKIKFGIQSFQNEQASEKTKGFEFLKSSIKAKKQIDLNQLKQKQFKRKVENDMGKIFPQQKKKTIHATHKQEKLKDEQIYFFPTRKKSSKMKVNYKSSERLQTNPDPDIQEYGLSVIRQKQKKSKSKTKKSNSKEVSRKSKQNTVHRQIPISNRLQTEYSSSSTIRLNTGQSMLAKSKSSSRIPTQYDHAIISPERKLKSKSKNHFLFANISQKDSNSSSISKQQVQSFHNFKKSKSKSKIKLLGCDSLKKTINK